MKKLVCVCVCLQILSYLVACDHLCQLGYDAALVEEALEMFQNCETKVGRAQRSTMTQVIHARRHFSFDRHFYDEIVLQKAR